MTTNAAESATAGVPVVRGLVWENGKAVSPIGRYSIQRTPDGYAAVWEHEELAHFGFNTDDPFQEAKKTVEADYEQRILSALNPDFLSELDTARAEIERLRGLVGDVHRVLCGTRDAPSHTVGADIEWCIDHCRIARATLSPAVKEPK